MLLTAVGASGDITTNFWSTFTSDTPEIGSMSTSHAHVSGGYLLLGDNGNVEATATATVALNAVFGQSGSFETNVVIKLDWAQTLTYSTTMTGFNNNGDVLFALSTDTSRNLFWNGSQVSGAALTAGFSNVELNLNADDTVDLYVNNTLYGAGMTYGNAFARNLSSLVFSREKLKLETASIDNLLVTTEAIPEPAIASFLVIFGSGLLGIRRFSKR